MENNENVAICGGNLFDENNKPAHSFLKQLPSIKTIILTPIINRISKVLREEQNLYFNSYGKEIEVGYVTGADMMIRKSVLNEVGGFDPEFFMYYEETELTNRVRKSGYKVSCFPSTN